MDQAHINQTLISNRYIAQEVELEENVYIGPHVVILAHSTSTQPKTILRAGAQIGANSTILPGITIGVKAQISPGSVVTRSVPPLAIVEGNPARIIGYIDTAENDFIKSTTPLLKQNEQIEVQRSTVKNVTFHTFRMVPDLRGNLSAGEFEKEIPFTPQRYFLVFDVPTAETRGEHAHKKCKQFLIAIKGSVSVVADDGHTREEFLLDKPNIGLYLPPMTWGIQYRYSSDAVLLVFASHYYDAGDYIRDYDDFLNLINIDKGVV